MHQLPLALKLADHNFPYCVDMQKRAMQARQNAKAVHSMSSMRDHTQLTMNLSEWGLNKSGTVTQQCGP
jgi:hypothetical protein